MKQLHRTDLWAWSVFNDEKNIDFNSVLWVRPGGNVAIDPLPLCAHDQRHLEALGGVKWIVVTNSDHVRGAQALRALGGAQILGPQAEQGTLGIEADRWLGQGDEVVSGLKVLELHGSKTPGELTLLLEDTTLITSDLVRAHQANALMLLPDAKLKDKALAIQSLRSLLAHTKVEHVLVGDGWHVFGRGRALLQDLAARLA